MRRRASVPVILFLFSLNTSAQDTVNPTDCHAAAGHAGAIAVEHEGETYHVTSEPCRQQFLSDPERYAQLFDALAELEAAGRDVPPPASLVPS